jgi:hypothetical protein
LHIEGQAIGRSSLIEPLTDLFKAFEVGDPPPKRQAAITPEFLKDLDRSSRSMGVLWAHASDLLIGGFFFAMRACEYAKTNRPGRTKRVALRDVTFRDAVKKELSHRDPSLLLKAKFVTITFRDQKNGKRMDRRSQGRSGHNRLCPVLGWARAVRRKIGHDPEGKESDDMCSLVLPENKTSTVDSGLVLSFLRSNCELGGGKDKYGFGPSDIGTRSIRSGAAMALFLMDHSVERIKILGRWSSDAFLVYIRPQVLEWTSIMAADMARVKSYMDLAYGGSDKARRTENDGWKQLGIIIPALSNRS